MMTDTSRRQSDTSRNLILNQTLTDLEDIINGHDPEVDSSINNGIWDRLDKMAVAVEQAAYKQGRISALTDAAMIAEGWGGVACDTDMRDAILTLIPEKELSND